MKAALLLATLAASAFLSAQPQSLVTLVNNGPSENRVDLVILAEGYTSAEQSRFNADVNNLLEAFFAQEPYREYQRYFNVHRLNVWSNQSGADHPERNPPQYRDTYFHATYNCGNIQRLICVSDQRVSQTLSAFTAPNQRDIVLLLVNDSEYGGSGGWFAVASTHWAVVDLALHEIGHSFALLADEYGGSGAGCNLLFEPSEPNATRATTLSSTKWSHWISPSTPLPTTAPLAAVPGLYEGSRYCDSGLFRPTYNSKMRTVNRPFEQINEEQHVKRIYNLVNPIDSFSPAQPQPQITQSQSLLFTVSTPQPLTHNLTIQWLVNGVPRSQSASLLLSGSQLGIGAHTVTVLVRDVSPFVRSDPQRLLEASRSWTVTVQTAPPTALAAKLGVFQNGAWLLDRNGNHAWDGLPADSGFSLDLSGVPVTGDWNAGGREKAGVYANGLWHLDFNGNHAWDGPSADRQYQFGWPGATPIVGDWNGDGRAKIGVYSDGLWLLDFNGNGTWDGPALDRQVSFGSPGATPIVGDWNGDGRTKIGVYSNGSWLLDVDGDFQWNPSGTDKQIGWGWPGATPVAGDWNGNGRANIGVYSNGFWFLDYDGDFQWNPSGPDKQIGWGWPGAQLVTGDWNGDGRTKIGVVNQGFWFLDFNGDYLWDGGITDKLTPWGAPGATAAPGKW